MEENMKQSMEELMESYEAKKIYEGDIVKGKIISVNNNEIIVNIGYISDGILPKSEIPLNEEENLKDIFKDDEEIYVYVDKLNDGEGNVLLSKIKADEIKAWDNIEKYFKNKSIFEVKVKEVVKGGVITYIKGIRAFIPASQLSVNYVKDLNAFKDTELKVRVIEFNKYKEKIVLSSREVEKEELERKQNELWDSLKKGMKVKGKVVRLAKFGAFVDIGGLQGLVHNSQLSWGRVNNPSEVVSEGDNVEVYVLDFNKAENKISLALKDVNKEPWLEVENKFKVDSIVEGKVVKLTNFGAFVEIEKGIEGLVHLTEISEENISKASDKLNVGDKVKVKILSIDKENKRMSLSIKEALDKKVENVSKFVDTEEVGTSLGDLLKDKLKDLM